MRELQYNLPGLRIAAIAFLAARSVESKAFCANSNGEIVPQANCVDTKVPGNFYEVNSDDQDLPLGFAVVPGTVMLDSYYEVDRAIAQASPDIVNGGFGKRQCGEGGGGSGS